MNTADPVPFSTIQDRSQHIVRDCTGIMEGNSNSSRHFDRVDSAVSSAAMVHSLIIDSPINIGEVNQ